MVGVRKTVNLSLMVFKNKVWSLTNFQRRDEHEEDQTQVGDVVQIWY